ncbi:uracil-DNA glycosylase family protein [Paracoccus denitrificans]|jgi:uracil-DNA glycosylase|uniref:uracil-DNA glycosylase family protein n=2 Tax=Paracoccaceae TaxID=31989 RepID=UPI0039BF9B7C
MPALFRRPGYAYLPDMPASTSLLREISACRLCEQRFASTATGHSPRPVAWFRPGARILVVGQAPGMRVHLAGRPFADRSGDRLRDWMGVSDAEFYDRSRIAIVPMAFCFPGYDAKGADLPPPPICARTWRERVMAELQPQLTLLVGGHAQRWHLGAAARGGVTQTVADWRAHGPHIFPLPHPSWRNTGWLRRNPWFQAELLPELRAAVAALLREADDPAG